MKRLNGIHLPVKKRTEDKQITPLPLPKTVRIPMLMHSGSPCVPIVSAGDHVDVGQLIGRAEASDAVPVHSSVSGTVRRIIRYELPSGQTVPCAEIETCETQLLADTCIPPVINTKQDLIDAARESGCVGLGGDGSLTFQKLSTNHPVQMLIVNGAECETRLSADGRLMLEAPEQIIGGIELVTKLLKIRETRIGVRRNRPAAIQQLLNAAANSRNITVCPLPSDYPQGAEKVLIFHTAGIAVPDGQTPEELGILVLNVSTLAFLYQYSQTGIPLVERVVTVDGDAVTKPCNLRVPIGTPVTDLLDYAACEPDRIHQLLCGGEMMGECITFRASVVKTQNGLIASNTVKTYEESACIRCGRCMNACPLSLMPVSLDKAYQQRDVNQLKALRVDLCMNCGCCTYVCTAKRPLAETIQSAKALLA
ncbi:MAG: RnfABCDGE type electron transport complex subunit C [Oscillospiraceae bacterium]|nr:RnfABCDGE type electron transport complex subunit C [Oscillospiraceae bacterium]